MSKLSRKLAEKHNYLLIGSPNVGKSTLFNLLTRSTAVVSNIDRMTTEHTFGKIKKLENSFLIDLPGIYNLSHPIDEEKEVNFHLLDETSDGMINIASAFSIQRDLFLTLQCIETGLLSTLVINMTDLINGKNINWQLLSKKLNGVNVVRARTNRNVGTPAIIKSIKQNKKVNSKIVTYSKEIENLIQEISKILPKTHVSSRFASLMILENNEYFINYFKEKHNVIFEKIKTIVNFENCKRYVVEIRDTKNKFIYDLLKNCNFSKTNYLKINLEKQNKFDRIFLNPWIGIPIFIVILASIYYITLGEWAGGWLNSSFGDWLGDVVSANWLTKLFEIMLAPEWVTSLFIDGIFGGLFLILPFLPTIAILYILITIMQQVGLISRMSVLLDNTLSKFGLSGRSVVNLLTGFGCSVPAVMLARSSSSKKERIISILIVPLVACVTKVIVVSKISEWAFPSQFVWLSTFGFIVLSGVIALTIGLCFSKILFRKERSFFCVEMVNWNGIDVRVMIKTVWLQIKEFLKKAFLIIIAANIVIWMLLHLGPTGYLIIDEEHSLNAQLSFLYYISYDASFIFYPIFGSQQWELVSALISGLPAKEIILTNLEMVAGGEKGAIALFQGKYGIAIALSFITFSLFYAPCLPTMNVIRTEGGLNNLGLNLAVGFVVAYVLALLIYWVSHGAIILQNPMVPMLQ